MQQKFGYLLDKKIITATDLNKAHQIALETNRSIEAILVVYFGIKRQAVGRSLSIYYDCPFRIYDSSLPISLAFLAGIKKSVLLKGCWYPYRWEMNGIEVLVEDPWDFTKNDQIRVYLKTSAVNFSVAIKEEIEDFIQRLFDERKKLIAENKQDISFSATIENPR
jgi:small-conductance mechanosensitive channel